MVCEKMLDAAEANGGIVLILVLMEDGLREVETIVESDLYYGS